MKYPVTIEQLSEKYSEVCGTAMPKEQKPFWDGVVGLIGMAYKDGKRAGAEQARVNFK